MPARDVDRDRVVLADVLGEDVAALAVEHDHARRSLQAGEEVVLPALVVVQAADRPATREGNVHLHRRLGQRALPPQLHEPAALVVEAAKRDPDEPVDHATRLTPFARTKSLTW